MIPTLSMESPFVTVGKPIEQVLAQRLSVPSARSF
jgi:hypothetical protein